MMPAPAPKWRGQAGDVGDGSAWCPAGPLPASCQAQVWGAPSPRAGLRHERDIRDVSGWQRVARCCGQLLAVGTASVVCRPCASHGCACLGARARRVPPFPSLELGSGPPLGWGGPRRRGAAGVSPCPHAHACAVPAPSCRATAVCGKPRAVLPASGCVAMVPGGFWDSGPPPSGRALHAAGAVRGWGRLSGGWGSWLGRRRRVTKPQGSSPAPASPDLPHPGRMHRQSQIPLATLVHRPWGREWSPR